MIYLLADALSTLSAFGDYLSHIWPIFVGIGALFALLKGGWRTVKKEFTDIVDVALEPVRLEIQHNGGGSLKDAVKRVEYLGEGLVHKIDSLAEHVSTTTTIASKNAARMSAVVANLDAAYYEMNSNGEVTDVNDAYLALFGITEKEALTTQKWRHFIPEEDLKSIDEDNERLAEHKTEWYAKFRVVRNGVIIPVTARAKPIFVNKQFLGYAGAMTFDSSLLPPSA